MSPPGLPALRGHGLRTSTPLGFWVPHIMLLHTTRPPRLCLEQLPLLNAAPRPGSPMTQQFFPLCPCLLLPTHLELLRLAWGPACTLRAGLSENCFASLQTGHCLGTLRYF